MATSKNSLLERTGAQLVPTTDTVVSMLPSIGFDCSTWNDCALVSFGTVERLLVPPAMSLLSSSWMFQKDSSVTILVVVPVPTREVAFATRLAAWSPRYLGNVSKRPDGHPDNKAIAVPLVVGAASRYR
jgi:hypothetical protein